MKKKPTKSGKAPRNRSCPQIKSVGTVCARRISCEGLTTSQKLGSANPKSKKMARIGAIRVTGTTSLAELRKARSLAQSISIGTRTEPFIVYGIDPPLTFRSKRGLVFYGIDPTLGIRKNKKNIKGKKI